MGDRAIGASKLIKKNFNAGTNRTRDLRLTTGSIVLDAGLGGGFPHGRNIMLWGEKSGGKSTTAARIVAKNQNLCRRCLRPAQNLEVIPPTPEQLEEDSDARWHAEAFCDCVKEGKTVLPVILPERKKDSKGKFSESAKDYKIRVEKWKDELNENSYEEFIAAWIDPEDAYDPVWAGEVGVDDRRLYYVRPENGEEASDIIQLIMESGMFDIVIVDSLAHFTPRTEIEEGAEKWQQGLQARLVNKGIRGWVSMGARNKNKGIMTSMIWVNQARLKIGVMFGDPSTKPGGKGQDFAIHAEVKFLSSKVEAVTEAYGSKEEKNIFPVKETIHFKITKNRTAPTRGFEGIFAQTMRSTDNVPAGTVMEDDFIFKNAMKYLVKEHKDAKPKDGGKYEIAGERFASQAALKMAVTNDPDLAPLVRTAILKELAQAR